MQIITCIIGGCAAILLCYYIYILMKGDNQA